MSRPSARTLSQQIRQALEADIILGDFAPGDRIDEKLVGSRFKASRTPVREALQHLASSGLVELRPHQGAVVAELTIPSLIEMFEAMAACEGFCARLAARRITSGELEALRALHQQCVQLVDLGEPMAFYEANNALHELIYAASRNTYFMEQTRALRNRLAPYRRYSTFQAGRMRASLDEHANVLQAIADGDGDRAETLMRAHLSLLGEGFADLVAGLKGKAAPQALKSAPKSALKSAPKAARAPAMRRQKAAIP